MAGAGLQGRRAAPVNVVKMLQFTHPRAGSDAARAGAGAAQDDTGAVSA